jgi:hypothetical protein
VETGLHYNYFRDFDPSLGIYKQSDPIGLRGGLNTYAYVRGAPLTLVDPRGLCPPGPKMKKCLEEIFGQSIDSIDVVIDPAMVCRHHGDDDQGNPKLGATTRPNTIYFNFPCNRFWADPEFVLHEYFHVVRQWGQGMTRPGYIALAWIREKEARDFAAQNVNRLKECLLSCPAPQ